MIQQKKKHKKPRKWTFFMASDKSQKRIYATIYKYSNLSTISDNIITGFRMSVGEMYYIAEKLDIKIIEICHVIGRHTLSNRLKMKKYQRNPGRYDSIDDVGFSSSYLSKKFPIVLWYVLLPPKIELILKKFYAHNVMDEISYLNEIRRDRFERAYNLTIGEEIEYLIEYDEEFKNEVDRLSY